MNRLEPTLFRRQSGIRPRVCTASGSRGCCPVRPSARCVGARCPWCSGGVSGDGPAKDSRWVDPAPLEVSRPRLPWWTLLPGWVKFVLSPVAACGCCAGPQVGRVLYRYPLSFALLVLGWWSYSGLGAWWFCGCWPGALACSCGGGGGGPRVSGGYAAGRTELRRLFVYAWDGAR